MAGGARPSGAESEPIYVSMVGEGMSPLDQGRGPAPRLEVLGSSLHALSHKIEDGFGRLESGIETGLDRLETGLERALTRGRRALHDVDVELEDPAMDRGEVDDAGLDVVLGDDDLASPMSRPWYRDGIRWCQLAALVVLLVGVGWLLFKAGPALVEKVIIPLLEKMERRLSAPVLMLVIMAGLSLLPVVLFPCSPLIWLAGIAYGYLWGYLVTIAGMALGMTLTYAAGHWVIHHRVESYVQHKPKYAALLRACNQNGVWTQFKIITLFRLSPFPPYPVFNYMVTATKISFLPYILGSVMGITPEVFVALYSGILMRDIADYQQGRQKPSVLAVVLNVAGVVAAISIVLLGAVYGRRALREASRLEAIPQEEDGVPTGEGDEEGLEDMAGSPRASHRQSSYRSRFQPPRLEDLEDAGDMLEGGARGFDVGSAERLQSTEVGEERVKRILSKLRSSSDGEGGTGERGSEGGRGSGWEPEREGPGSSLLHSHADGRGPNGGAHESGHRRSTSYPARAERHGVTKPPPS